MTSTANSTISSPQPEMKRGIIASIKAFFSGNKNSQPPQQPPSQVTTSSSYVQPL